ncbi:MAG: patatin family protein [Clostridia bacterium]|jgi:predicted patatin/cPLA2 family phospholipase|nr:patatin family protein [Clostridia bacterium]MCI2000965.1 patatin family protein [Clostridia bacterium]MCI2015749.1 patatin family protein [Clostridia bacterium]
MKVGVIDVGGGLRGIYGAGVFDWCIENTIVFDYCIGVSAGSANVASYLAGQKGRNFEFYIDYSFRKEYMSLRNLIKKGSYIDMDYVYGVLSNSNGENPLDEKAIMKNPSEMIVVATEAESGNAKYFDKRDLKLDDYYIFKASSSIPVVCHPYPVNNSFYFDGALSDPVPIKKAFSDGCDKVVVVLTKPRELIRTSKKDERLAKILAKKYPKAAANLCLRAKRYNEGVKIAKELEAKGKAVIIAPDDITGMSTLTKNRGAMKRLYDKGYNDAKQILSFVN